MAQSILEDVKDVIYSNVNMCRKEGRRFELISDEQLSRDKIVPKANIFDDLGVESHDKLNIWMDLEDRFAIRISEEEAKSVFTVGDIERLVEEKLSEVSGQPELRSATRSSGLSEGGENIWRFGIGSPR